MSERERELERLYPTIAWREPLAVKRFDLRGEFFACRFCIALVGLKGKDVARLPTDREEVRRHIASQHLGAHA
jgi:hypothetical protein